VAAPPTPAAFGPTQAFTALGVYFGAQAVVGFLIGMAGGAVAALRALAQGRPIGSLHLPPLFLILIGVVSSVMGAGGAIGISLLWRRGRLRSGAPAGFGVVRPALHTTLAGIVAALLLALAFRFVAPRLVPFDPNASLGPATSAAMESSAARAIWIAFALLLAPPLEEYLFRGVLLAGLRARFSTGASVATVTLLFVLGHAFEAIAYWPAFLAIAGMGVLTAGLRVWSGSIFPGLAAHVAYNLVVVAATLGF
jgi:hypothetical protein